MHQDTERRSVTICEVLPEHAKKLGNLQIPHIWMETIREIWKMGKKTGSKVEIVREKQFSDRKDPWSCACTSMCRVCLSLVVGNQTRFLGTKSLKLV